MIYFEWYIKEYREKNWLSTFNKEELLDKYWVNFLMYLYQEATFEEDIIKIDNESKDLNESWEKILEKYWELWLIKAVIIRTNLPRNILENISDMYYDVLYQDMMNRIIQ